MRVKFIFRSRSDKTIFFPFNSNLFIIFKQINLNFTKKKIVLQFSQILPLNEIWIWLNTLLSWLLYAADVRDCLTDKKKWKCYAWSYTEDSHCVNLQLDQQKMTVSDDIFHDLLCVWRNQKFWIFNFEPNKKDEKIDSPAFHYKYFNVSNRIKWGLLIVTIKQIAIHIDIMVKKLKS